MKFGASLVLSISLVFSLFARADEPQIQLGGKPSPITPFEFSPTPATSIDDYRIGDEFGKHPARLNETDQVALFNRALQATVRVRSATGFYLGEFASQHVIATNYHVCPAAYACASKPVTFEVLGKKFFFKNWIGSWKNIELALFTIDVSGTDAAVLKRVAMNFDFSNRLYPGQPLYTIGFGIADNPDQEIVANYDSDCMVFSDTGDFRLMSDPDELNPGTYRAWSFATGCDVSHGDSGSAMLDRNTGSIVGLIWTGKIPTSDIVRNSAFLDQVMLERNQQVIWKELSYAVPAAKIAEYLMQKLENDEIQGERRQVIMDMLSTDMQPLCPVCM